MEKKGLDQKTINQFWRDNLTSGTPSRYLGPIGFRDFRKIMKLMPKNPRCKVCSAPFSGIGGTFVKLALGRERSTLNPNLCNICENFAREYQGGAEIEISMLFADVRGSTFLAEEMTPLEFSLLIDRFYRVVTDILIESNTWIEKLIGDEVTGLFIPGYVGQRGTPASQWTQLGPSCKRPVMVILTDRGSRLAWESIPEWPMWAL
jgi:adenylate cyclase